MGNEPIKVVSPTPASIMLFESGEAWAAVYCTTPESKKLAEAFPLGTQLKFGNCSIWVVGYSLDAERLLIAPVNPKDDPCSAFHPANHSLLVVRDILDPAVNLRPIEDIGGRLSGN